MNFCLLNVLPLGLIGGIYIIATVGISETTVLCSARFHTNCGGRSGYVRFQQLGCSHIPGQSGLDPHINMTQGNDN